MKLTVEPPPAYFVHVPKTGGISLGRVLEDAYLPWDRVRLNPPVMRTVSLERFCRFRFYHSFHQGRRLLEMTGRSDLLTITMVRDPVERSVRSVSRNSGAAFSRPKCAYSISAHVRHAVIRPVQAAPQPLRRIAKRILGK